MSDDSQIFIREADHEEPIEYLLTKQPMEMIQSNFVTKEQIREVIELGKSYQIKDVFSLVFWVESTSLVIVVEVHIDRILRTIEKVEKSVF